MLVVLGVISSYIRILYHTLHHIYLHIGRKVEQGSHNTISYPGCTTCPVEKAFLKGLGADEGGICGIRHTPIWVHPTNGLCPTWRNDRINYPFIPSLTVGFKKNLISCCNFFIAYCACFNFVGGSIKI